MSMQGLKTSFKKQIKLCVFVFILCLLMLVQAQDIPKPEDNLTLADRAAWFEVLKWPVAFEEAYQELAKRFGADAGLMFFDLGDELYLVQIKTYQGAYQEGFIYMTYHSRFDDAYLISLPNISKREDGNYLTSFIEIAGYTDFDPDSKVLSIYSKSRGMGGCGSFEHYRFERFQAILLSSRSQRCEEADAQGEDMILNPDEWPLVWPPEN